MSSKKMRECRECGQDKPIENYRVWRYESHGDAPTRRRYQSTQRVCKACRNKMHRQSAADRNWDGDVAKMQRDKRLRLVYGMTLAEFDERLAAQGGGCWVCGAEPGSHRNHGHANLAVDHDHETGAVRGLLCHMCNRALGLIEGHTDRMAEYVTKEREGAR